MNDTMYEETIKMSIAMLEMKYPGISSDKLLTELIDYANMKGWEGGLKKGASFIKQSAVAVARKEDALSIDDHAITGGLV